MACLTTKREGVPRSISLLVLLSLGTAVIITFTYWQASSDFLLPLTLARNDYYNKSKPSTFLYNNSTLGVSKINVISLPGRTKRRADMELLRAILGLKWTYIDATPTESDLTRSIHQWVKGVRHGPPYLFNEDKTSVPPVNEHALQFEWPQNIDALSSSRSYLDVWSPSTIWSAPSGSLGTTPYQPIACATGNYHISNYTSTVPEYLVLNLPRVACWYSHLSVIHKIANDDTLGDNGVAIVLEDDVNMERDIHEQLQRIWKLLPAKWDIVYLGHCWSNETYHPSSMLTKDAPTSSAVHRRTLRNVSLHRSRGPKCTHAYALSRGGARRLLLHLRYPPFAFSRAIDQAMAWLIESNRLRSFSIVPSLVVQRKIDQSDITTSTGVWKEKLVSGIFDD